MNDDGMFLRRVSELCELYQSRWGSEVDLLALPSGIDIMETLERIVDTGESPIVGWKKIKEEKEKLS
jgi:hypothetical protein